MDAWRWREAGLLLVAFEFCLGHALLGMMLLTVLVAGEVFAGEPVWVRTRLDPALLALFAVTLLSGMFSEWRENALTAALSFGIMAFVIVRAVVLTARRRPQFPIRFLAAWAAGGTTAALWAGTRLGTKLDVRADLPDLTTNELGIVLATALVLLAGFSAAGTRRSRMLATVALPPTAVVLALTWSRGAWLGAAVGLAVLLAGLKAARRWYTVAAIILPVMLAVPALVPRWPLHVDRMRSAGAAEGPFSRIAIWRLVPSMVAARPMLGTGLGTFQFVYEQRRDAGAGVPHAPFAHNLFLNFLAETGLLGLAALLWLLWSALVVLVRWMRRSIGPPDDRLASALALAATATLLVHQMVDGTALRLHITIGLFALFGLGVAGGGMTSPLQRGTSADGGGRP